MSYPMAAGVPSMSGIYIPEIWSGKLLEKFYTATVFGSIANTDYEGEISQFGDTVHIRQVPDITIRDYSVGQTLTYEDPESELVDLLIDKGKYYAFKIKAVEKKQSDIAFMDKWSDDAGSQMKIKIDSGILSDVYADAHASNAGATAGAVSSSINLGATGSPIALDKTNIVDELVNWGTVLDEQNVPEQGRWAVLPAWACNRIKRSELKDASLSGDGKSMLRNGRIGMVDRFTLYMSNQIATTTDGSTTVYNMIAGHMSALTFASQLVENEKIPNPNDFGELMRGLQVYGYETVKSEALVHIYGYAA